MRSVFSAANTRFIQMLTHKDGTHPAWTVALDYSPAMVRPGVFLLDLVN